MEALVRKGEPRLDNECEPPPPITADASTTSVAKSRFLRGALEPCPREGLFPDLEVVGQLPIGLRGTLYRVGPNPRYLPHGSYHPFFADGMAYAFSFGDGRVSFQNRWIRTRRFLLQEETGTSLFDGLGNYVGRQPLHSLSPQRRHAALSGQNTANTNIVAYGGTLLALSEAGLPYQVDRQSLHTIGTFDFGRTLSRSMSGHPKVDSQSGTLFGFSYGMTEPFLVFYEYSGDGRLVRTVDIPAPFPSMVHDFVVTEHYIVFMIFPVTMRESRIRETGSPFGWEPELGTHVAVLSRNGDPDIRWFSAGPCYAFHAMNGFDDEGVVRVDLVRYDALPNYFTEPYDLHNSSRLVRWTLDLDSGELGEVTLSDTRLEMPRVDPRYVGKPYRHGYSNGGFRRRLFHSIEHFDVEQGRRRVLDFGDGFVAFEPVIAPWSSTAGEGNGFVLAIVGSESEARTDLLILDAQQIDEGPIATVRLPHRVNGWFHGSWVPENSDE
jgi:carotenoid cleavage dioxygenase